MEKPILGTNIDGFLIDHSAFIEPHKAWFDRAIAKTSDKSLEKWKGSKDYFIGVNKAMEKIMPNASKEKRTAHARKWYSEDVIYYIKMHPEVINNEVVESLKKLKSRFTLALITTNTKEYVNEILRVAGLSDLYDIVYASSAEEEPSKENLFNEFIEQYEKPIYYLSGKIDASLKDFFKEKNLKVLGVNDINKL